MSISKLFQKKKKNIIEDNAPNTLFRKSSLKDFINADNPYLFIQNNNAIDCSDKEYL